MHHLLANTDIETFALIRIALTPVIFHNLLFYIPLKLSISKLPKSQKSTLKAETKSKLKSSFFKGCIILGSYFIFMASYYTPEYIGITKTQTNEELLKIINDLDLSHGQYLIGITLLILGYTAHFYHLIKTILATTTKEISE